MKPSCEANETQSALAAPAPWYAEHLARNFLVLALLAAVDHLVLKPWVAARCTKAKDVSSTRWFFLHALANLFVCATALTSIYVVLTDPVHALDGRPGRHTDRSLFGDASVWPLTIINSVHVYHMVGGFQLSAADYFHHLLFIPTLGFPGQVYLWGSLGNFEAFFISGLPGGIDYAMLGMQKVGLLDHMVEKRVNAALNAWVRMPGILVSTVLCYQAWLLGTHIVPTWAVVLQLVLPPYNAIYFGKQATANYAVHYMLNLFGQDELIRDRLEMRTSKSTGTEVMAWKDALGVPQRGS